MLSQLSSGANTNSNSNSPKPDTLFSGSLKAYNQYYKTKINSMDELKPELLKHSKVYFDALQKCIPGVYHYESLSSRGLIFVEGKILGFSSGICYTQNSFNIANLGMVSQKCQTKQQDLFVFSNAISSSLDFGSNNHANDQEEILKRNCQNYLNGKLTN